MAVVKIMPEDTVDAAPSDDNGNVPVDAPSEPTPEPEVEDTTPSDAEPELYELPDGRQVDAATLATEFRQNFLPEFTRKSQELAQLKQGETQKPEPTPNVYEDPDYIPQSYAEIIEAAKREMFTELEQKEQARVQQQEAIETAVIQQLDEVKAIDPNVNENQLFLHANKYGFRDLKIAHQNMRDMSDLAKKVQTTTAQNIQKRADPVSIKPGGAGTAPNPGAFASAVDYVRSLKT